MKYIISGLLLSLIFLGAGCKKQPEFLGRLYGAKAVKVGATYSPSPLSPSSSPPSPLPSPLPETGSTSTVFAAASEMLPARHRARPEVVRGIYITAGTAAGKGMDKIAVDAKEAGINSLVIDLKDYLGNLAFSHPDFGDLNPKKPYFKPVALTEKLHKNNFYLIARIPVFEDTYLAEKRPKLALKTASGAIWRDNKGLAWLDPAAREVWNYNLQIAKLAYTIGFDEIQFDYIRFATDGATDKIIFPFYKNNSPKSETVKLFFEFLNRELRQKGVPISVDLFGITFWSDYDYNIGQKYLDALSAFDFVSPMVYPSHFPANFRGYKNPADHPYEIIKLSMQSGLDLAKKNASSTPEYIKQVLGKFRPWLQAFDMGAVYNQQKIVDQVRGACDAGATGGWIFWNARNVYNFKALGAKQTCIE